MTNEKRAEQLRKLADEAISSTVRMTLLVMADDLYTPKPEPGQVVWYKKELEDAWELGFVQDESGIELEVADMYGVPYSFNGEWPDLQWKYANVAGPDEVVVSRELFNAWMVLVKFEDDWNEGTLAKTYRRYIEQGTIKHTHRSKQ